MINMNSNVASSLNNMPGLQEITKEAGKVQGRNSEFTKSVKAVEKYLSSVNEQQNSADTSVKELLAGKNEDITSVVSQVAKADMSFKLLVGVRNKLIEAYKQTMNMQI